MLSITYREEIERCIAPARPLAPAGTDADNGKLTLQPARRSWHASDL
ncbi:MAG TPA: hypothetical protein VF427_09195 [Noviherbaspirillum sp.]